MDIYEPTDSDDVIATLEAIDEPVAFFCSNQDWFDAYLDSLTSQDWVTSVGVGYDRYPVSAFEKRGIRFTNTVGIQAEPMCEHVFGLLYCYSRGLLGYYKQQEEARWKRNTTTTDFAGETCCIVGLGRIGEAMARRARAFDMHVRGIKRSVDGYDGVAHEVFESDELHEALRNVRIVIACVPLTPATTDLLDYEAMANCGDDAIVVNVARGNVVNTDALLTLLNEGELERVFLDVFNTEPLPPDSSLWDRDDVLVTPHAAATTDKAADRIRSLFLEQYKRWNAGIDMENVITQ